MKNLFKFLTMSCLVLTLASCDDKDEAAKGPSITTYNAMLMGSNEVPANNSSAMGTATLLFNNTTKTFVVTGSHNVVGATVGHIHMGAAGTNGGVVFGFTNGLSPINYTSVALTAAQEADLNANMYYVNIHSATFPGGELRGQLIKGATTTGSAGGY